MRLEILRTARPAEAGGTHYVVDNDAPGAQVYNPVYVGSLVECAEYVTATEQSKPVKPRFAAKRKTIEVKTLVEKVNHMLADSIDDVRDARYGMIGVLESVLHDTGNYNGFMYLPSEKTTADQPHVPNTTYLRIGYDDTRRHYYLPR